MAKIVITRRCPMCGTTMTAQENGTYICPNPNCECVTQKEYHDIEDAENQIKG